MKLSGKNWRGTGAVVQDRLLQIALRENIPIRTETPVEDLIVESPEGQTQVVGAIASHHGKTLRIRARGGVLINVGGYSRNADFRQRRARQPSSSDWTLANPGDTGEIIEAAMRMGAATDLLDAAVWGCTSVCPDGSLPEKAQGSDGRPLPFGHHFDISFPHVILVDQDGQRFADEAGSYVAIGERMYENQLRTGRNIPAWAVIESRHRRRYPWGTVLGRWPRSWFESGYMVRANSIEELAAECAIEPAKLRLSIERFNGFCRTGVDEDFGRGGRAFDRFHGDPTVALNPNLGAIERPPFYACRIVPGDVGTSGGLVTDENARVLRDDGSAIGGLYACGNSAATVFGRSYPGAAASIAHSLVFGYRAAQHVVSTTVGRSHDIGVLESNSQ